MMVQFTNHSQLDKSGGASPRQFVRFHHQHEKAFEHYAERLESFDSKFESFLHLDNYLANNRDSKDKSLLRIAVEKYGYSKVVSSEDVSETAKQAWDNVALDLKRYYSDLYGYSKVIQSGTDRIVERLNMLRETSENIKDKPFKPSVSVRKNNKYGILGKFEPTDIRPCLEQCQDVLDFGDYVLLPFMFDIAKVMSAMDLEKGQANDVEIKFEQYNPQRWMKGSEQLKEPDSRFRVNSVVFKSVTAQGNKALFFGGPDLGDTESTKDWHYLVNNIKNIKFKYYTVQPNIQKLDPTNNVIKVPNTTQSISQQLNYLVGAAKRIQARAGMGPKISDALKKIENVAETLRRKAGQLETPESAKQNDSDQKAEEPPQQEGKPSMSNVVHDITVVLHAVTRLITDYNNALAGQLRLIASLGLVADKQLKAFEAPIRQPNENQIQQMT